jgi:hypothetical protein
MSTFPNSPRLLKGTIIGVDPFNPLASVIVFQYNPDTMTRRLEPRAVSEGHRVTLENLQVTVKARNPALDPCAS